MNELMIKNAHIDLLRYVKCCFAHCSFSYSLHAVPHSDRTRLLSRHSCFQLPLSASLRRAPAKISFTRQVQAFWYTYMYYACTRIVDRAYFLLLLFVNILFVCCV